MPKTLIELPAHLRYLIIEIIDKYLSNTYYQRLLTEEELREVYEARNWTKDYPSPVREPKVSRGEVMAPMPDSPQALQTSEGLKPFTDRGYSGTN